MASRNGRNLRVAAAALVVAAGLTLLSSASDTANATSTGPASARTYLYVLGVSGLVGFVERCCPGRWNVYDVGSELIGKVRRGDRYRERWNVYSGDYSNSRSGYAESSSGGRWNVYEAGHARVRAGYVKRSYGNRWSEFGCGQYSGCIREGYAQGPGGVVGGAALLLLFYPR